VFCCNGNRWKLFTSRVASLRIKYYVWNLAGGPKRTLWDPLPWIDAIYIQASTVKLISGVRLNPTPLSIGVALTRLC
jgi:hypothetical protein